MAKPVILAVDDEPEVLNFIERDLRHHYAGTYRVMKASSGSQALETVRELKQRGMTVALFLVDERMPGMTTLSINTPFNLASQPRPSERRGPPTGVASSTRNGRGCLA